MGIADWGEILGPLRCHRCEAETEAIYPLRGPDGHRAAWCARCIVKYSNEITEQPINFNLKQMELFS